MDAITAQNWIMTASLVITMATTIVLQIKSSKESQKTFLDKQLFELQRMSLYDPFMEDKKYTSKWNDFKLDYQNDKLSDAEQHKFLKYEVYTEMLFNFIEMSLKRYNSETKLLNYVDFKSWVRTHAECWKNPLEAHSNREVYGDKMCDMIDKWLK